MAWLLFVLFFLIQWIFHLLKKKKKLMARIVGSFKTFSTRAFEEAFAFLFLALGKI